MTEASNQLQRALKAAGQSLTKPRRVVFDALQDREPQTMHQIVQACAADMDRASVYRTINLFERLGITQRLQIGWKYMIELSDAYEHHHHHMSCSSCGALIPFPEDAILEQRLLVLASSLNFTAQDHQIEIRGICKNCRSELASN